MSDDLRIQLADAFRGSCEDTAKELEKLAATIRGLGEDIIENVADLGDAKPASALAATIVHKVSWGIANARMDRIVSTATEFDAKFTYASPAASTTPEVEVAPETSVDEAVASDALMQLNGSQEQALLELAAMGSVYGSARVPTLKFAAPSIAASLQHCGLAEWGYDPNRGYKITPLGAAAVKLIKNGILAKLAEGQEAQS